MKNLLAGVLATAMSILLIDCAPSTPTGSGMMSGAVAKFDKQGNPIEENVIVKKLNTIQEYLQYVDLERVYMSTDENGSPAFFLGVPSVVTSYSGFKKEAAIGYYFKAETGRAFSYSARVDDETYVNYRIFLPFDDNAKAIPGQTGHPGFPCLSDDLGELKNPMTGQMIREGIAKMDLAKINAKAIAAVEAIAQKPESQRTDAEKDKYPELTSADLQVLNSNDPQKIEKARLALAKLHALMNGFRLTAIPRGGIQSNCQAITDEEGQKPVGLAALSYLLPASGYEGMDREFYVTFRNAVEKTVNGKTVIVSTENPNVEVKADQVVLMTDAGAEAEVILTDISDSGYAWVKRPESTVHNADLLIQLYRDLGYEYKNATTAENTTAEPWPALKEYCGWITAKEDGTYQFIHNDDDYNNRVDVSLVPAGLFPLHYLTAPATELVTAVSKAPCGCISGLSTYASSQEYYFDYLFEVDNASFKPLSNAQCTKYKK